MEHSCNHFVIHATGYLTAVNSDAQSCILTFDLAPKQYTNAFKSYNKNLKPGSKKSSLPLRCIIEPSSQWPMMLKLQVGHIVSVSGFISRVLREVDGKIQFFEVEVEQVNILAKTAVPIATPVQFADTSMPVLFPSMCIFTNFNCNFEATATPLKRKGLQFDFSQATPSPLKKARRSDASSLSSPSPQRRS